MPFSTTKCAIELSHAANGVIPKEQLDALFQKVDARKAEQSIKDVAQAAAKGFEDKAAYQAFSAKRTEIWNVKKRGELSNRVKTNMQPSRVKGSAHSVLMKIAGKDAEHLSPAKALEAIPAGSTEAGIPTRDNADAYRKTLQESVKGWLRGNIKSAKLTGYLKGHFDGAINEAMEFQNTTDLEARAKLPMADFKNLSAPDQAAITKLAGFYVQALDRCTEHVAAEGGYIPKREGYVGEQTHDRQKIRNASTPGRVRISSTTTVKDQRAYTKDLVQMLSADGTAKNLQKLGRLPDDKAIDPSEFSRSIWEVMTTGIRKDTDGSLTGQAGNIAAEAEKARILEFKDAQAFTAYAKKYGIGVKHEAINAQIDRLMHTAATLHFFGPSAKLNFERVVAETEQGLRAKLGHLSNKSTTTPNKEQSNINGSARSQDHAAGARAGNPEAAAHLVREGAGTGKAERGSSREERRRDLVDAYEEVSTRLGKKVAGSGLPADAEPLQSGAEHDVFKSGDRVYKILRAPEDYGITPEPGGVSDPASYLERHHLQNSEFGDDIKWEGVNEFGQTVVSQPHIEGETPTPKESNELMRSHGFEPTHPETEAQARARESGNEASITEWKKGDIRVSDAESYNFLKDANGKVRPIDLAMSRKPSAMPAPEEAPGPYDHLSNEAKAAEYDRTLRQIDELNSSRADSYMETYLGVGHDPSNQTIKKATGLVLAWNRVSMLGSAFYSNLTSVYTHYLQTNYAGVPHLQSFMGPLFTAVKRLSSDDYNAFLRRSAIATSAHMGQSLLDIAGGGQFEPGSMIKRWENNFYNLIALTPLINSIRASYVASVSGEMAAHSHVEFNDLPVGMRRNLADYAIDGRGWDILRQHAVSQFDGWNVIASDKVRSAPDEAFHSLAGSTSPVAVNGARLDLEAKLANLYRDGADYASVSHDLKTELLIKNLVGDSNVMRLTTQFSTFPMAHGQKVLQRAFKSQSFLPFLFKTLGGLTLTGMLNTTLRQTIQGKQPLSNPDLWSDDRGKSALAWGRLVTSGASAAGVGGIASDLLFSQSYQGGVGSGFQTLLGPTGSNVVQAMKFMYQGIETGQINGAQAMKWAQANTPFVNIWWLKPMINYGLMYGLEEQLHPGTFSRMEQNAKTSGAPYWLPPTQYANPSPVQ